MIACAVASFFSSRAIFASSWRILGLRGLDSAGLASRFLSVRVLSAPLAIERRVNHDGMISVVGNLYSVPDAARKRALEIHIHAGQLHILENGALIAVHPVLEGKNQCRLDPSHRGARTRPRTAAR